MTTISKLVREHGEAAGYVIMFLGLAWAHPGLAVAAGGLWLADAATNI